MRSRHVCRKSDGAEVIHDQPALAKKLQPPRDYLLASWVCTISVVAIFLILLFVTVQRHPRLLQLDLGELVTSITALDIMAIMLLLPLLMFVCINLALHIVHRQHFFKKVQRWHALYYCTSHNIVFFPDAARRHVPPSKMHQLL